MAAPEYVSILDVTGRWFLNRDLSDSLEPSFALQGIPWIIRKVINFATLEIQYVQETRDAESPMAPSFAFKQIVRPGGFDTSNRYIIDGEKRTDTVPIFGELTMHAIYLSRCDITQEQTLGNKIEGAEQGHVAILETVENANMGWTSVTVWGFEMINGERRFCKYNVVTKGDQRAPAKMVYDYAGPP